MARLNYLHEKEPRNGSRFFALFADGGGGDVFIRNAGGYYLNADGVILSQSHLEDCLYFAYVYLPKEFRLWFERVSPYEQ